MNNYDQTHVTNTMHDLPTAKRRVQCRTASLHFCLLLLPGAPRPPSAPRPPKGVGREIVGREGARARFDVVSIVLFCFYLFLCLRACIASFLFVILTPKETMVHPSDGLYLPLVGDIMSS